MRWSSGRRLAVAAAAGAVLAALALQLATSRTLDWFHGARLRMTDRATVAERLAAHGADARARLEPQFAAAGVAFPPGAVLLAGFKRERRLELHAGRSPAALRFVHAYRILAASGGPGPKLREGDLQVPEGVYPVESLNPNSRFHLALRIGYPNEPDRAMARADGRERLGGDIMIHGGAASVGCLAVGDEAVEDLFVLAALVGAENVQVLLSPVDFRTAEPLPEPAAPRWVAALYETLRERARGLQARREPDARIQD